MCNQQLLDRQAIQLTVHPATMLENSPRNSCQAKMIDRIVTNCIVDHTESISIEIIC